MNAIEIVKESMPAPSQLLVEDIDQREDVVVVRVSTTQPPRCPACSSVRVSYHSRYDRRLRDLPWQGRQVQLRLRTRRFRCRNGTCRRKIFAERLPGVAAARARESRRLCEVVGRVGYALGGLPGARLLGHLGIVSSADTVLRRVKAQARKQTRPRVRVLGVDDWAWRKRQRYGTLLMDLEEGRVIDLLPDRSARSFAAWLGGQDDVEIISRDRCGLYADGARQGAPAAQQITDRYHLVSNLAEAIERDVQRLQIEARVERGIARSADKPPTLQPTLIEARRQRCRQARLERFQTVIDLGRRGHHHYAIAHQVGISAGTVSRWLHARAFPERQLRSDRQRERAPFRPLYAHGGKLPASRTHYSSGRVASLLLNPERRSAEQKRHVDAFLRLCPQARDLRRLALRFRAMLRWRKAKRLAAWMNAAVSSEFYFLAQFARVLRRDVEAVKHAITSRWSNGPVEGHINRLKMIKRQMYGRAGFELLRARVLPWECAANLEDSCTESA
jgi:transposase